MAAINCHQRFFAFEDIEIRNGEENNRIVSGLAAPYDTPARVREGEHIYTETLKKGSFARSIQQRASKIKVCANHDHRNPIGSAQNLEEIPEGLYCELKISKTRNGDELIELIRDEVLDSFSVGFDAIETADVWNHNRSAVTRNEVKLREISLVAFPAYEDARVLSVRSTNVFEYEEPELVAPDGTPLRDDWALRLRVKGLL